MTPWLLRSIDGAFLIGRKTNPRFKNIYKEINSFYGDTCGAGVAWNGAGGFRVESLEGKEISLVQKSRKNFGTHPPSH